MSNPPQKLMNKAHTLIAGIGNIFACDDAFGVATVQELMNRPLPKGVRVRDFGTRDHDLAFAIADGYETVILVDATPRGDPPGTVYLLEIDISQFDLPELAMQAHAQGLGPVEVLRMARGMAAEIGRIYLVGCEPEWLELDAIGMSETVRRAVPTAVEMIHRLLDDLQGPGKSSSNGAPARP